MVTPSLVDYVNENPCNEPLAKLFWDYIGNRGIACLPENTAECMRQIITTIGIYFSKTKKYQEPEHYEPGSFVKLVNDSKAHYDLRVPFATYFMCIQFNDLPKDNNMFRREIEAGIARYLELKKENTEDAS